MKDIVVYNKEHQNLCSIKPVEDIHPDRMYILSLIDSCFNEKEGLLYIEASRPNYDVTDLVKQLITFQPDITNLSIHADHFELSFMVAKDKMCNDLLYLIPRLWFAFEHTSFCVFLNKKNCSIRKRTAWYEITNRIPAFIMYRGIEEDVVWIGKSDHLMWPLMILTTVRLIR